jgi:hypothetical protein
MPLTATRGGSMTEQPPTPDEEVEPVDPTTDADADSDAEALVDDESPSSPFNDVPNGSEED